MILMRLYFLFALLAALATAVFAWEKEDHEIFDLVSALENAEGKGTTFYSFLGVPSTANTAEISKAYRKLSMQLHPDKNPGVKGAHERFSRLGVITTILRTKDSRKRYDFFYKNGVPKWRGTGYYYSRFRPGLGTVATFLIILTSALQLVIQKMNYKRDLARIDLITSRARRAAWGPKLIPTTGQRKVRVSLGEQYDEDGPAEGGRTIELIVDGNDVFMPEEDGTLHPLGNSTAVKPAVRNTWFIALIKNLFYKVNSMRKGDGAHQATDQSEDVEDSDDISSTYASDATHSGTSTPKEGKGSSLNLRALPVEKAGGKRRKVGRR